MELVRGTVWTCTQMYLIPELELGPALLVTRSTVVDEKTELGPMQAGGGKACQQRAQMS